MKAKHLSILALVIAFSVLGCTRSYASSERAFLGIVPGEVTSDIANDYGVEAGKGVLVESVVSGSAAEKAGLRENDVLVKLDGAALTGPSELRVQLKKHKKGDTVELVWLRGGKEKTASVEFRGSDSDHGFSFSFGSKDDDDEGSSTKSYSWRSDSDEKRMEEKHAKKKIAYLGVVTQELNEGLSTYFKVKHGALISEIEKDSPADKAGLKAGDVLTKIAEVAIFDEGDVRKAVRVHDPGETVEITFNREGTEQKLSVTLGEQDNDIGIMLEGLHDLPNLDLEALKEAIPNVHVKVMRDLNDSSDHISLSTRFSRIADRLSDDMRELGASMQRLKLRMQEIAANLRAKLML